MKCVELIILLSFLSVTLGSTTIDLITGEKIKRQWLSFGAATLNTDSWVTLQSESSFVASGPTSTVVLLSLPDLGGPLATDGIPTATRIRNVVYTAATGRVTFDAKIFVPNDTFCLKTWYNPTHLFNQQISFLVAEKGVYLLDNNYTFVVSTGQLNRTTSNLLNRSNWFYFSFPRGCGGNYAVPCSFPTSLKVAEIGVVATIQSLVFDTYLLLRVFTTQRTRIGMILTPHDSLTPSYFSSFDKYVTAGYVAFPTGFALTCIEGVQFETASFSGISSNFFEFNYKNTYLAPPHAFGMLVTQYSLTDSTSIRVFNRTKTRARAITQEDQCASEQVLHTTPERVTMFIFSLIIPGNGIYCFSNDDPTSVPTRAPTMVPTRTPTSIPTNLPTASPTRAPTTQPSVAPTALPTVPPTSAPTVSPTRVPTAIPTSTPTRAPTRSPTVTPTHLPSFSPTDTPSQSPTPVPTTTPTRTPTTTPTVLPTDTPTSAPTRAPTVSPVSSPTTSPTGSPTSSPTRSPTSSPTFSPSSAPTSSPTGSPTCSPTSSPSGSPTRSPTSSPTGSPTRSPTSSPTSSPTWSPTGSPTSFPTYTPTASPTLAPTTAPTSHPSTTEPTSPKMCYDVQVARVMDC